MTGYIIGLIVEGALILGLILAILCIKFFVYPKTAGARKPKKPKQPKISYEDLSDEIKGYYDEVKNYALSKEGAKEYPLFNSYNVRVNGRTILKLKIKRGAVISLFRLENQLVKNYRLTTGNSASIYQKDTEVHLFEAKDVAIAKDLIDLSIEQIAKEKEAKSEEAKARRLEEKIKAKEEKAAEKAKAKEEKAAEKAKAKEEKAKLKAEIATAKAYSSERVKAAKLEEKIKAKEEKAAEKARLKEEKEAEKARLKEEKAKAKEEENE